MRPSLPLPPGPRPLPILGNLFDMPTKQLGPSLRDMADKYGDVVYLDILGQPMVVVNSFEAALTILESRSANTSDRPQSPMAELCGFLWQFSLKGYTQTWRQYRKDFHSTFHPNAIPQYRPIHLREGRRLLQRLLETPENYLAITRHAFSATIMDAVYGIVVAERDDPVLARAEKVTARFSNIVTPGKYLVEVLPALRFLPSWLPGAQFKRNAEKWRPEIAAARDETFHISMDAIARGDARPCALASLVEKAMQKDGSISEQESERFRDVTAIAFLGKVLSTLNSMHAFFLAMVQFPEAQRKAQRELDAVIGPDRLPEFADRDALPYVRALVKEVMRWHSVAPTAIAHRTVDEDEYKGYRIPAGSIIVPNSWAMSQDPVAYPQPEMFIPERFLRGYSGKDGSEVRDPERFQFGFVTDRTHRICPGRHFANDALFLAVASVLHTFDIRAPLGLDGKPLPVAPKIVRDFFLSYPEPFECTITPRSEKATLLIRNSDIAVPKDGDV
ncbi:O-methylsterigmatocystin oxidoreductase [Trametes versicolor FP-101664 SS1]|uniref:O-methylsterigmatocystin oxidoreductase n=1 Tax=Trametes versicolor (strain FP-101664) TaxID=717944 RepID=UPI00046238C2|nr:O-methylsterigmatocystin oxidoreductase [Trametes versicolor FP-101664 SS1]EIW55318.1 O-methylsterigmatocystin oxidoreductase [Trametes versicolor FP-101664 SS1]